MYQDRTAAANQNTNSAEDFLLGKEVKQLGSAEEKDKRPPIIPVIRDTYATPQNEAFLKMMEDPMVYIKQKEMEARSQLIDNPMKMKQIREEIEALKQGKKKHKKDKKDKKHKKDKKSSKSSKHSSRSRHSHKHSRHSNSNSIDSRSPDSTEADRKKHREHHRRHRDSRSGSRSEEESDRNRNHNRDRSDRSDRHRSDKGDRHSERDRSEKSQPETKDILKGFGLQGARSDDIGRRKHQDLVPDEKLYGEKMKL